MIGVATIKMVGLITWLGAAVFSTVDPIWATPLNTLLLLVTVVIGAILNRKVNRVQDKQEDMHQSIGHSAAASASAAEAAATAARITKELGGLVRTVDPPVTGTTDTTEGGGV